MSQPPNSLLLHSPHFQPQSQRQLNQYIASTVIISLMLSNFSLHTYTHNPQQHELLSSYYYSQNSQRCINFSLGLYRNISPAHDFTANLFEMEHYCIINENFSVPEQLVSSRGLARIRSLIRRTFFIEFFQSRGGRQSGENPRRARKRQITDILFLHIIVYAYP